jgi:teichuronic acid biosynthesis glycosyltransferase TuaG
VIEETKKPLVSVIMPCYKMGRFIGEALESVGAQTYTNWEVIAVDDCGPEDGTKEAVEDFAKKFPDHRILYHRHEKNGGVSAARNTAIGIAQGEYLAFLDPDDIWDAAKLEQSVCAFSKSENIVLSHHPVRILREGDIYSPFESVSFTLGEKSKKYRLFEEPYFLSSNHICASSVVVKKQIFKKILFPERMVFQYEDWAAWNLLGEEGRFYFLADTLASYRFHGNSYSYRELQNPKIHLFSELEMLLCIISRSNDKLVQDTIIIKIGNNILKSYSKTKENWGIQGLITSQRSFLNFILRRTSLMNRKSCGHPVTIRLFQKSRFLYNKIFRYLTSKAK